MPQERNGTSDDEGLRGRRAEAEARGWTFTVLEPVRRGPVIGTASPEREQAIQAVPATYEATAFLDFDDGQRVQCIAATSRADLVDRIEEFDRQHGRL
jgi:hypothetical protein